jgi:hypothetical protein
VPRLPSTPQQWVSQWTAATLQSPAEVCDHLYAPALSRAFEGDTGHSCASYYTSVKSISEVRGGWQAVDVVPGGSVRAR